MSDWSGKSSQSTGFNWKRRAYLRRRLSITCRARSRSASTSPGLEIKMRTVRSSSRSVIRCVPWRRLSHEGLTATFAIVQSAGHATLGWTPLSLEVTVNQRCAGGSLSAEWKRFPRVNRKTRDREGRTPVSLDQKAIYLQLELATAWLRALRTPLLRLSFPAPP